MPFSEKKPLLLVRCQNNIIFIIFFVKRTLVLIFRGHITHLWPQGTPSGTPNHNPYHQTVVFFLCPNHMTKTLLARNHRVKKHLSFLCEKDPSLGLQRPYHTSMAIGDPLRHPKPQPIPPNYCIFPLSKLYDKNTARKVSLSQKDIISIIFL